MAFRACVCASFLLATAGAVMAPGCGCEVHFCCEVLNSSRILADIFNDSLPSHSPKGFEVTRDRAGFWPACSLLNLIPGVFDEGGMCSDFADGMQNTNVCEAIAASEKANDRLQAGRTVLSNFVEPGTCAELQGGVCWESREGTATYQWDSFVSAGYADSWCTGQVLPVSPVSTPALAWSLTCPQEGGLSIRAKWVDGNATEDSSRNRGVCSRDFSGGLEATIGADGWTAGSDGSPRWRCFDVPRGDVGPSEYRILAYIIGDLPCVATTTNTTKGGNTSEHIALSGSCDTSLAVLAHVAAAAIAVGTMLL